MKQTVAHYNWEHTDVYCAIVDLSKAQDKIIISSLCDKLKAKYLPDQIVNLIEFIGKNTFVCSSYEGCLNDEWKEANGIRLRGITSGILF